VVPGQAKTAGSLRTITAPPFLIEELARHLGAYRSGAGRGELVFVGPRGGVLRRRFGERTFRKAVQRAGLDPPLRDNSTDDAVVDGSSPSSPI
jgi:integrase